MKKIKNITIFSILSICLMLLCGGKVFAASVSSDLASFDYADGQAVICVPDTLSTKGDRAECYYIVSSSSSSATARGFVLMSYTTNYLTLEGGQSSISGTGSYFSEATSTTGSVALTINDSTVNGSCVINDSYLKGEGHEDDVYSDTGCLFAYSTTDTHAFVLTTMRTQVPSALTSLSDYSSSYSNFGVVGYLTVELSDDVPDNSNDCGEICVRAWAIRNDEHYDDYAGNDEAAISGIPVCDEVHFDTPGTETEEVPETGAFASYAVLVAGALIAISVVAMAKKNSKFNKV